jgi:hypothetical protein
MIYIKVQYDAYNRTLKLIDREAAGLLEDYSLYDLAIPLILDDTEEQDAFIAIELAMAHA